MGFMAAYRNLERMFNNGQLNILIPGALSAIRQVRSEYQKVIDDSTERKHRAERAEAALERQQNDNYRLAAELEKANEQLAQATHRLSCVLNVTARHDVEPSVCRPCHLADKSNQARGVVLSRLYGFANTLASDREYNGSIVDDLRRILDGLPREYQIPAQEKGDFLYMRDPRSTQPPTQIASRLPPLPAAAKTPKTLADKIALYAAHLETVAKAPNPVAVSNITRTAAVQRAELAREMAAIIFRAEEHAKRPVDLAGQLSAE